MKLLLSLTLAFIGTVAYAQNFKMVDTTPTKEVKQEIKYDSLTNIRFSEDKEYHKQFIGQSILFYPRNPNSKSLPEYFANFTTPQKQAVAVDTVWYKRRKKPRPADYKLDTLWTNRYKPQYVENKGVTLCVSTKEIPVFKNNSIRAYYFAKTAGGSTNFTGDFTPYTEIEGKVFKITNISYKEDTNPRTIFTLLSEEGNTIYWDTNYTGYNDYGTFMYPVITTGYIEKMKQLYLNKDIYIVEPSPVKKYRCTEIVYSGSENQYMVPSFVLKSDDGELILPLSLAPSLFSYEIEIYDQAERGEETSLDRILVMNGKEYAELTEKEKLATGDYEKEDIIKKQKRKQYLYKKYGPQNGELVFDRRVREGMPEEMCLDAWGEPKEKTTTYGPFGLSGQWLYGGSKYIYFEGGIAKIIQY